MAYFPGLGAILRRGQSSGASLTATATEVYDTVILVAGLKIPDDSRTVNSFTTLDQAAPRTISGGFDTRVISFRLVMDFSDTIHLSMKAAALNSSSVAVRRNWQITLPDTGAFKIDYTGFISKWSWEELTNEKEIAAAIEITTDTNPVETP